MEQVETRAPTVFTSRLVQIIIGAFLLIALLNDQHDFALLAILLLVLLIGANLWSRFSPSNLTSLSNVDRHKVFPGESIRLDIEAKNGKLLPVWLKINVPIPESLLSDADEQGLERQSGLLWFQRVGFSWELIPKKRGIYPIGPAHITVGDLLGFYPKEIEARDKNLHRDLHIVVYPRLVSIRPFVPPKRELFGAPGSKSPFQDPVYILGTRDYQPWRPARFIHWKASARQNQIQEKIFEPSEQAKILLVLDVGRFAAQKAEEEFEQTLEVVASMAVQFERQGYSVGLVTNGHVTGDRPAVLPVRNNPQQLPMILETLAGITMEFGNDIQDLLQRGLILRHGLSGIVFTYDDDTTRAGEGYFKQHRIPIVFFSCKGSGPTGGTGTSKRRNRYFVDDIRIKGEEVGK